MTTTCPSCNRVFSKKGMGGHMRHCTATPEDLFWTKVDKNGHGGCWLWLSYKNERGYGLMTLPGGGKNIRAHRYLYELTHGPIPKGQFLLHKCDVRHCVNPDHLYFGMHRENTCDMYSRNRVKNQTPVAIVLKVRELLKTTRQCEIVKTLGLLSSVVSAIKTGKTYSYITSVASSDGDNGKDGGTK